MSSCATDLTVSMRLSRLPTGTRRTGRSCGIAAKLRNQCKPRNTWNRYDMSRRSTGQPYQVGYQQRLLSLLDVRMVACRGRDRSRSLLGANASLTSLGVTLASVS
jgi:hypothetical protein